MEAFLNQAQKLTLTSRAVYSDQLGIAQKRLHEVFGYDKALMMNTGVEAGESAVKFCRRWGYAKKNVPAN